VKCVLSKAAAGLQQLHANLSGQPVANSPLSVRVACGPGYVDYLGSCVCDKGSYATGDDKSCEPCPLGLYKDTLHGSLTGDGCQRCEAVHSGSYTVRPGAVARAECVCPLNRLLLNGSCKSCLEGMSCSRAGLSLATVPLKPGYWRTGPDSTHVLFCPSLHWAGGNVTYCAAGYAGPFCTLCDPGLVSTASGDCTACTGLAATPYALALHVGVVAAVAGAVAVLVRRKGLEYLVKTYEVTKRLDEAGDVLVALRRAYSMGRVLLVYLQISFNCPRLFPDVRFPQPILRLYSALSVLNANLGQLLTVGCFFRRTFYTDLLASTLALPALALLLGLLYWAFVASLRRGSESYGKRVRWARKAVQMTLLLVSYATFPSIGMAIFQTFSCRRFDDGRVLLQADYS
jgi:hypothetical protein